MTLDETSGSGPLLDVQDLTVTYGHAVALDAVSLQMAAGERLTLIGPNGAGKTSLVNAICGMVQPRSGTVRLDGRDVTTWSPARLVGSGVAQVPEGRQVFPSLTVEANLLLGAYGRWAGGSLLRGAARYSAAAARVHRQLERVYDLMPKLHDLAATAAGHLSGGEQQMVAIGRALMTEPRLLVVDELSLGLAPRVVNELAQFLQQLNEDEGVGILLIEQNARLALDLCPRAYVLGAGTCRASGTSAQLRSEGLLEDVYLGGGTR